MPKMKTPTAAKGDPNPRENTRLSLAAQAADLEQAEADYQKAKKRQQGIKARREDMLRELRQEEEDANVEMHKALARKSQAQEAVARLTSEFVDRKLITARDQARFQVKSLTRQIEKRQIEHEHAKDGMRAMRARKADEAEVAGAERALAAVGERLARQRAELGAAEKALAKAEAAVESALADAAKVGR